MQAWFSCNVAYTLDNVYTLSESSNPSAQMCGRVACSADASSVQRATGATRTVGTYRISYNLSPGQNAPVDYSGRDGARTLHAMKWGLETAYQPMSKSSDGPAPKMVNARSETVRESPVYRRLLQHHRCVLVVGGFFEWCANGTKKQPYFVELDPSSCVSEPPLLDVAKHESTTSPLMYLASLFETTDDGKTFTFTVLTTAVADNLTWLHNRMPVILDDAGVARWLDPTLPFHECAPLCAPKQAGLRWHAVPPLINDLANFGPACISHASEHQKKFGIQRFFVSGDSKVHASTEAYPTSSTAFSSDGKFAASKAAASRHQVECQPNHAEASRSERDGSSGSPSPSALTNSLLLGKRKGVEWIEIPDDD